MRKTRPISVLWRVSATADLLGIVVAVVAGASMNLPATAQTDQTHIAAESASLLALTLDEAIQRAQANEPSFAAAQAESRAAGLDRWNARAGLLPSAVYHNQATYTQSAKGSSTSPQFIASNGVHEYVSQAVVNETLGVSRWADVRRADASAARAAAELEIARRGLVAAVSALYYCVSAAESKRLIAERAHQEALDFLALTRKREQAREAAHADGVKAQLVEQQRSRDLSDAQIAAEKARLELGVLVFADPRTPFTVAAPDEVAAVPTREELNAAASKNNPELKSALASLKASNADVLTARAAYLPDLNFNYTYGIDAAQLAVNAPDHTSNLGHSVSVTVDLPVWDWLSTQRKLKQSEIRRDVAKVTLTATQKHLLARLDEAWSEATAARAQLSSLEASVATAAESLRLTKLRYAEGESSVLEVVDAQTAYVGAANAREDGRLRYQASRADLQTLTGTL